MRLSCNGCRVLRKGCSEDCTIRPCLQWIKSPEAQANVTVFLAKFYGRAGLLNLINAGSDDLRPSLFRSLLYEACGRIVNPVYGSVGLLWSGKWQLCQDAVEAVLRGEPIAQLPSDSPTTSAPALPLKSCDIRHVAKDELHKVSKGRTRFKRAAPKPEPRLVKPEIAALCDLGCHTKRALSHESAGHADGKEDDSVFSVETGEASHVSQADSEVEEGEVGLELTLGLEPVCQPGGRRGGFSSGSESDSCRLDLALQLPS